MRTGVLQNPGNQIYISIPIRLDIMRASYTEICHVTLCNLGPQPKGIFNNQTAILSLSQGNEQDKCFHLFHLHHFYKLPFQPH